MSDWIDRINEGAILLRDIKLKYQNLPQISSFEMSKSAPYFGYVDVKIAENDPFVMFSNNDDFVAKNYFWNGPDSYEPMSLKLWAALARESSVILDIGSYTGVYALSAAAQNKKSKIYAFEAIDFIYSRLLINKMANQLANMQVENLAVSDSSGEVEFNVYAGDSVLSTGSSLIEKPIDRVIYAKKRVRAEKLDDLVDGYQLSKINLIKIDAEGAEHLIFRGGREVIREHRPDIICEFLVGAQTQEIEDMLSSLKYKFYRIHEDRMGAELVDSIIPTAGMNTLNTLISVKSLEEIMELYDR